MVYIVGLSSKLINRGKQGYHLWFAAQTGIKEEREKENKKEIKKKGISDHYAGISYYALILKNR